MEAHGRVSRCGVGMPRLATGWAAFLVLALPLSTTETAQGDIVTLHVAGTVTNITRTDQENFDLDGSVVIGSPYQLTFVIDTDAPDLDPHLDSGQYLLVASSGQFGTYTWSRTDPPVKEIQIKNNLGGYIDEYHIEQHNPEFTGTLLVGGVPTLLANESFEFIFAGVYLPDESMTALDSDALVIPSLNDWGDDRVFGMNIQLDEDVTGLNATIFIDGTVDSITTPEPGAAAVVGLLWAAYVVKRRDRNYPCSREILSSA